MSLDTMRAVFGMFLGITTIIAIPSAALYVRRRHVHPIKGRPFSIILFYQLFIYFYTSGLCIAGLLPEDRRPCLMIFLLNQVPSILVVTTYSLRTWLLVIRINIETAKLLHHAGEEQANRFLYWLLRHKYLMNGRNLFLIYSSINVLTMAKPVITVFVRMGQGTYDMYEDCEEQNANARGFVVRIVAAFVVFFISLAAWKLRDAKDGFYIKSELKMTAVFLLSGFIFYVLFNNLTTGAISMKYIPAAVGMNLIFLACSTYPAYRSYRKGKPKLSYDNFMRMVLKQQTHRGENEEDQGRESISAESRSVSLREVLDFGLTRNLFLGHCEHEFTTENVLFWEAVRDFKQFEGRSDREQIDLFMNIFSCYIHQQAPLCVNVSHKNRMPVYRKAVELVGSEDLLSTFMNGNQPDVDYKCVVNNDIFERLESEVYDLMSQDIYPRFVLSVEEEVTSRRGSVTVESLKMSTDSSMQRGDGTRHSVGMSPRWRV